MGLRHIRLSEVVLLLLGIIGCAAAWWLPLEKDEAILGRFDYVQFLILVFAHALFLTFLVFFLAKLSARRKVGFRLLAVWLGILVPLGLWELGAYFLPAEAIKNPWYLNAKEHEDGLPYRRPAHIEWSGRSPGQCTFGYDPTAETIEFSTDKNGFRNPRDLDQAEIVFLGDSFTEGMGVDREETFAAIVGRQKELDVANLGRSGYSPGPELRVLEYYGIPLKPNVVVWQLCEGNDLEDSVTFEEWLKSGRARFYEEGEWNRETRADAWARRSPTCLLFTALRPWPYVATFETASGSKTETRFYRPLEPVYHCPQNHPGWNVIVQSLADGVRLLEEKEIRLVLLLAPLKLRVMQETVTMSEKTRQSLYWRWNVDSGQTWSDYLERLSDELGVELVDPTDALREAAAAGREPYLPYDTHFSPLGHKIVAEEILRVLEAKPHE